MDNVPIDFSREAPAPVIPPCWSLEPSVMESGNPLIKRNTWASYWEALSDRQRRFREQSDEYVRKLESAVPLESRARVLDFGCGFGFVAQALVSRVGEVFLWDSSANMRRRARLNLAGRRNVRFLDLSEPKSEFSDPEFDLILVNSVVQYMSLEEFSGWLLRWRNMLAPDGRIVVSDLIPPDYPAIWDIVDQLRFGARRRVLATAIWEALSEVALYWKVRRAYPLSRIGCEELRWRATSAGLSADYLPYNLTYFTKRLTAVVRHIAV